MSISSEAKKEVERLLQQGRKIQAVKYLHDTFDISLADAQVLVEAVELEQQVTQSQSPALDTTPPLSATLGGDLKRRVQQLLQADRKIEAVKLVKTELNVGLKEALFMVEEIHQEWDPNYTSAPPPSGCLKNGAKAASVFFAFLAFVFLGIAGAFYYFQARTIKNSELLTGKVVELKATEDGSAPVVYYQWKGKNYSYTSDMYSKPPAYDIGEEVSIYVNRDNPEDIVIDSFTDRWLLIVIFGGIGAFFLFFASIFFLSGRSAKKY